MQGGEQLIIDHILDECEKDIGNLSKYYPGDSDNEIYGAYKWWKSQYNVTEWLK